MASKDVRIRLEEEMRNKEDAEFVKAWEMLRQKERLLALEYGAEEPPRRLAEEDLECDDRADVEHWVKVYTELVDFTRSLLDVASSPGASDAGSPVSGRGPNDLRSLMLQARVQELHLRYWTDRLNHLGQEADSAGTRSD